MNLGIFMARSLQAFDASFMGFGRDVKGYYRDSPDRDSEALSRGRALEAFRNCWV